MTQQEKGQSVEEAWESLLSNIGKNFLSNC